MSVRSRRFFGPTAIPVGGAAVTLYTVPAGRTARISSLRATAGVANTLFLAINGVSASAKAIAANGDVDFITAGAWVLNPGDVLVGQFLTAVGFGNVTGFGALLLGEPA